MAFYLSFCKWKIVNCDFFYALLIYRRRSTNWFLSILRNGFGKSAKENFTNEPYGNNSTIYKTFSTTINLLPFDLKCFKVSKVKRADF